MLDDVLTFDAVVLAGGGGRRLGGADKAMLDVCGRTALERVLDALSGARTVIGVGPARDTGRQVVWCREDPPGGGPAAGLAAAVPLVTSPAVVVLGVDYPLVTTATVSRLLAAMHETSTSAEGPLDGSMLVDAEGRDQPLVAAYRRTALAGVPGSGSLLRALSGLRVGRVEDADGVACDCDTWADVDEVRRRMAAREGTECSTSG